MKINRTCLLPYLLAIPALGTLFSCAATESSAVSYAVAEPATVPIAEPTPVAASPTVETPSTPVVAELTLAPDPLAQYQQAPPSYRTTPRHQHGMFLIGQRDLENSIWEGMDKQFALGFTFDKQIGDSGLAIDGGFHFSGDDTSRSVGSPPVYTTLTSDIFEIDLGLLKMFYLGPVGQPGLRPYIGAGAAFAWANARVYRVFFYDDTDFTFGMYGRAGLAYQLGAGALIGADFRYLGLTDVNLQGFNGDIDGWVFSLALGYGF